MSPPDHALVLCCDERSQVQALDRTQPGLPLKKGRAATMTHNYKRHGTTALFAALNVLDGQVIGQCQQRHTHVQWLEFLRQIDRETPKDKTLHLIADNYATHKHPVVRAWLPKRPRFNMHFERLGSDEHIHQFRRKCSSDPSFSFCLKTRLLFVPESACLANVFKKMSRFGAYTAGLFSDA